MGSTIPQVGLDANTLFDTLSDDLTIDLTLPVVTLDLNVTLPSEIDNEAYADVISVTMDDLTTQSMDGTGVFDALMKTMSLHLSDQFAKQRITGKEYGEVYLGGMQSVLMQSVSFLLGKDKVKWEALLVRQQVQTGQIALATAKLQHQLMKLQVVQMHLEVAKTEIEAHTARAQYATAKMSLATGFRGILQGEAQTQLVLEQYETARANTKDTLSDGVLIQGITGVDKQIKLSQLELTAEQVDAARAQTKSTMLSGGAIGGLLAKDLYIKDSQGKLIFEQYEGQRGQVRGTLSTGESVIGVLGAQTALYLQQIESYKHDSKSKVVKIMYDTWMARKTIDEGVEVPSQIDTAALNASMSNYRAAVNVL